MGGGAVLIPALTVFAGVEQHIAQATNLIAFLPMSAISLGIHKKQGLVADKGIWNIIIPAVLFSVLGGFAASLLAGDVLRKMFGVFLIFLGLKTLAGLKFSSWK